MIYFTRSDDAHHLDALPGLRQAMEAFEDIESPADMPAGRCPLLPGRADLIIDRYTPSPDRPQVWETHRIYADVQIMLSGEERFGWLPLSRAPLVKMPYDAERDACFYHPPRDSHGPAHLPLTPGLVAVFLPEDVHAPGLVVAGSYEPRPVTKAVIKLRLSE